VQRRFDVTAPNRLWVADFTHVPDLAGMVYVALVIDAYAQRILGGEPTPPCEPASSTHWRWRSGPATAPA
jgi:transposase InsO family protein